MRSDRLFEMIKELRAEPERLDHVIRQVEALAEGRPRRGRPPKVWTAVREELRERRADESGNTKV